MGGAVWYIVMIPCCMLLSGIGVFSWAREKPMWFWTEPRVSEAEISDVVKYNRENGVIVGFGDMCPNGYPDRLYVHRDFQRHGTARAICDELERFAGGRVTTHASITAKPFFLNRGYRVVREQEVIRRGVAMKNYVMEKYPAAE